MAYCEEDVPVVENDEEDVLDDSVAWCFVMVADNPGDEPVIQYTM